MNKEEILAKSREENKDKDLYELSIEKNATRVGVIVMYIVAVILTVINFIQTGYFSFIIWIMAFAVDAAMDIYKAVKLRTKKAVLTAAGAAAAELVMTFLFFRDLYGI